MPKVVSNGQLSAIRLSVQDAEREDAHRALTALRRLRSVPRRGTRKKRNSQTNPFGTDD